MNCHITFIHRQPNIHHIRQLALCVEFASRHYDVIVRTNLDLSEYAMRCELNLVEFHHLDPWIRHKLDTYALNGPGQFLHIDSDVFLKDPLPERLINAPLFAQSPEGLACYGQLPAMPKPWLDRYAPPMGAFKAYNMGIFGGDPGIIDQYVNFAEDACRDAPPGTPPNICEQAALGGFAYRKGLTVECLLPEARNSHAVAAGYTHLMADKEKPFAHEKVEAALERENPELAERLSCNRKRVAISNKVTYADVKKFWSDKRSIPRPELQPFSVYDTTLTNTPVGLGDTIVLSSIIPASKGEGTIWLNNQHLSTLTRYMPAHRNFQHAKWVSLCAAGMQFDLGAGHHTQRACRLFNLPIPRIPKGYLIRPNVERHMDRVTIHLDPGRHADSQRKGEHPRARLIGPQELASIRQFIDDHPELRFYEIGSKPFLLHDRVENCTGWDLDRTILLMSQCGYHLGILSGPTHLAAALDMRIITLTVMPGPHELMLPTLVDNGVVETEWMYPQSCVLHQEIDSPHMPLLSAESLSRAFDGKVWPYWDFDNQVP